MPRRSFITRAMGIYKGWGWCKVSEAAVEYIIAGRKEDAMTTISSKNQITLPAPAAAEMGVGPGDRLAVTLEGTPAGAACPAQGLGGALCRQPGRRMTARQP